MANAAEALSKLPLTLREPLVDLDAPLLDTWNVGQARAIEPRQPRIEIGEVIGGRRLTQHRRMGSKGACRHTGGGQSPQESPTADATTCVRLDQFLSGHVSPLP